MKTSNLNYNIKKNILFLKWLFIIYFYIKNITINESIDII